MSHHRRTHCCLALAVWVLGSACQSKHQQRQTASSSASVVASATAPKGLRINDAPVPIKSALAIGTTGESALQLTLASAALDCESLRKTYLKRPEGTTGTTLSFWVSQAFNSDGSQSRWGFRSAYLDDDAGWRGLRAQAALVEDLVISEQYLVFDKLEFALLDQLKRDRRLAYDGKLEAEMCGRVARKEQARPQKNGKLQIAGIPFTLAGASIRQGEKQHHIRLSRAPHDCNTVFTEDYDFYLDLVIHGDPLVLKFAALQGSLFPDGLAGSDGRENFQLELRGKLDGRGPLPLRAKGKLDLRAMSVELDGQFHLLQCMLGKP